MPESVGADILTDARIQVANESRSFSHRLKTKIWYTARKQLRHLPGTLIGSAGSAVPIPVLGSVLNAALDAAVDKVHAQSLEAKKRKYRGNLADWPEEKEALRKLAKFEAKLYADAAGGVGPAKPGAPPPLPPRPAHLNFGPPKR